MCRTDTICDATGLEALCGSATLVGPAWADDAPAPVTPSFTRRHRRRNEFTTEGGKLYPAVKGVMESTDMLAKAKATAAAVRNAGGLVVHVPIMFKADASDNPNKALGILWTALA